MINVITLVMTDIHFILLDVYKKLVPDENLRVPIRDIPQTILERFKRLTHDDYPEPFPHFIRGRNKYVVEVSIPRAIRPLMPLIAKGKGKGKIKISNVSGRRKVAGPNIEDYHRKKRSLTAIIYAEFDAAQEALIQGIKSVELDRVDDIDVQAMASIGWMLQAFPKILGKGESKFKPKNDKRLDLQKIINLDSFIPDPMLTPNMGFQDLWDLRIKIDQFARMVWEDEPTKTKREEFYKEQILVKDENGNLVLGKDGLEQYDHKQPRKSYPHEYSLDQRGVTSLYMQPETRTLWEDLLTQAASLEKKPRPEFPKAKDEDFWFKSDKYDYADPKSHLLGREGSGFELPTQSNQRPRQELAPKMSSLMEDFKTYLYTKKFAKINQQKTAGKVFFGVKEFIELMGDFDPRTLDLIHASEFVDLQLEKDPERSKKVLKDRNWSMNVFLRWCGSKRIINNVPFYGHELENYQGTKSQSWLEYIDKDLDIIFDYDWAEQERLLISLALASGMRINEIACLTWERIINLNTIQYVSLLPDGQEQFSIKNEGSKRLIPLHPAIRLPKRSKGRIFNYTIDDYGHATSSAGRAINPIIDRLVQHKRKSFHSFRSTFKIKLRATGCPTDVNKQITGHGSGDVSTDVYDGSTVEDRYNYISKLELPWLKKGEL